MSGTNYFQSALSGFTMEAACGGAVRHLVDSGYTLDQIVARLDYPASRDRVQRIMMDYLYESHMLLREEPSEELLAVQTRFVQEQDACGRRSFRKVRDDYISQRNATDALDLTILSRWKEAAKTQDFLWKESVYEPKRDGKLTELLHRKCEKSGEIYSYVSCPFGKHIDDQYSQKGLASAGNAAEATIGCLNGRQREYLRGIRWDQPVIYHRLNRRMLEIIGKLYEAGAYDGVCFFLVEREKMIIPAG